MTLSVLYVILSGTPGSLMKDVMLDVSIVAVLFETWTWKEFVWPRVTMGLQQHLQSKTISFMIFVFIHLISVWHRARQTYLLASVIGQYWPNTAITVCILLLCSLSFVTVNEDSLGFGLLVGQKKLFGDIILGLGKLR